MTARIIDGKAVAASVQEGVRTDADILKTRHGVTPGLATILVGEDPASRTYVAMKQKTSQELGMFSVGSHVVRQADILVAAIGKAQFVKADWIKPGATVIDVGTNSIPDATKKSGYRLVGDVDFEPAREVAGAITPVPGGVGPMTIAMLMRNTCDSAKRSVRFDAS